jgi:SEC-C motif-containing protein
MRPPTAEALMRSRYAAYASGDIDHIAATLAPESRGAFDRAAAKAWATQAEWLGLDIRFVEAGGPGDTKGVVAFVATYRQDGKTIAHHEVSQFRRGDDGAWLFVSGGTNARVVDHGARHSSAPAASHRAPKVGRNAPCPCGSGKKYKACCGP